ncbi:MAG: AAA family ATPase [Verrucomicrobiales bacterium]|nr:AAA family ATPase [Verrucomicrobiales bacterium]
MSASTAPYGRDIDGNPLPREQTPDAAIKGIIRDLDRAFKAGKQDEVSLYLDKLAKTHRRYYRPGTEDTTTTSTAATGSSIIDHDAKKPLMSDMLANALLSSLELQDASILSRKDYLGGWLCEGDYGIIFAPRGLGKTWQFMAMAQAMSANKKFGPWAAGGDKCKVLYVDGEMPLALTKARDRGLTKSGNLHYLHHDVIFEKFAKALNLARQEHREAIRDMVASEGINVLFLDNFSTLASGLQENDAREWEGLGNWFLELRHLKITVILVHHAGRNGQMRGTSKREDMAAWILSLTSDSDAADEGAKFVSHFSKRPRVLADNLYDYSWQYTTDEETKKVSIYWEKAQSSDRFRALITAGVSRNNELAEELGVTAGTVSKLAKRGVDAGWLKVKGREYFLNSEETEA